MPRCGGVRLYIQMTGSCIMLLRIPSSFRKTQSKQCWHLMFSRLAKMSALLHCALILASKAFKKSPSAKQSYGHYGLIQQSLVNQSKTLPFSHSCIACKPAISKTFYSHASLILIKSSKSKKSIGTLTSQFRDLTPKTASVDG